MANTYNKYQLKRTSVSGRTPNTTSTSNSSFLDTAELALNLTDKKMFSSNGTALFEIGANLSSINVTGNTIFGNTTINGFANITGTLAAGNTTIVGFANVTTINSGNVTVTGIANVTGNVSITDTMFGNNVVLTGNLTVSGTTTYINTVTLNVGDNIVTLNADWPAITPTENAGIEVNRGSLANVQFVWDETNDRWTTNNQPMFVGGALGSGNTTVTGFANVSSFLNVVGAATVNGALVVNNTAATGNLTVTGFINVSSSGTFGGNLTAPSINTNSFGISNTNLSLNTGIQAWHHNGNQLSITAKETASTGLFFSTDGTKVYVVGTSSDAVHQYNLSTPYNVSTGVFANTFSIISQDTTSGGIFFKPDGTKMYMAGQTGDATYQYTLATPWDISTATYDSVSLSILTQDTSVGDIFFSPDGVYFYMLGYSTDTVSQYTLATPWLISSGTFTRNFSVAALETVGTGISFTSNGLTMFIAGQTNNFINRYTLSVAWDISTAVYVDRVSINNYEAFVSSLYYDGTVNKAWVVGSNSDTIYEFDTVDTSALKITSNTLLVTGVLQTGNNLTVEGSTHILGNAKVESNFSVDGTTTLGTTNIGGTLSATSTLTLGGAATSTTSLGTTATTGTTAIGGTTQTGSITVGQSTGNQAVNIATGATIAANLKTINIGTGGLSGSFTNVIIGSSVSGANNQLIVYANTAAFNGNVTVSSTANVATAINVGANVNLTTASIKVGNSTVNAVHNQTNIVIGNTTVNTTVSATAITSSATLAIGNTTITGFANVSSTLNVVGAATVNGALTVNNTAATGNLTVTGLTSTTTANVTSSLNVVGAATVNGALTVNNTAALGNTTTTGFINVSSYGTFGGTVNATAINVGANVNLTTSSITVGNSTVNTTANSTLIGNQTIGGPNTGIMLNGMNMFAFSNSGGNEGNPTFRSSIANNQTVLRVLPNGVVNVATQAQFEFFGVDYFSNTTNWHNFRILAQTDRFVIDTARGANSDPARPIVFDIGGTGSSNATNANYPAVLVLSANGKVGISNATPDATLTVTGTANVSGNTVIGGTLSVTGINASGNTTITGFLNVSSYGTFGGTVNATALNIGANVSVNTTTIAIGNSTANALLNSFGQLQFGSTSTTGIAFHESFANYFIAMKAQGASQAGRLDATSDYNMYFQMNGGTNRGFVFRGNGNASNGAVAQIDSTGNFYTLGSHYIGNTTTNTTISTSLISIGNSTVNTQISAGNVFLNGSLLTVGNTTVNTSINNGTANVSTLLNIGANVNLSTTQLNVGNATVNAVLTSTSLAIANSANVTTNGHEFVISATAGQFKLSRDTFGNSQGLNFQSNGSGSFLYFNSSTNNAKPTVVDVPTSNTTADIYLDLRVAGLSRVKANSTIVTITGAANVTGPFTVSNTTSLSGNTTITGFANVSSTLNVVGAATVNGAFAVNNTAAFGNTTITGTLGTGNTTITGSLTVTGNTTANNLRTTGSVQIDGNLTVSGNTISIGVTNLSISDNLISLNEPETVTVTSATSNATSFIYTANNGFFVGQIVTVTGMTPAGYNVTSNSVTFANATTFAVANTVAGPGAYVSGGTAAARVDTNPDIGFTGNYNDGTYRHAGFFRDATDGVFKVFDQYLPEPTGAFINTANASFRIADFQSNNTVMGSANVAGTTRLGVSNANYLQVVGAASAGVPTISAQGTDASIDIGYATKSGANHYFRTNGTVNQFVVAHTASAVNYLQATGGATGAGPTFSAQGTDTNIDVNVVTKGTGGIYLSTGNGIGFRVYDGSSGAPQVNFFAVRGRAAGSGPYLVVDGTDTNISANFGTKGTGAFSFLTVGASLEQFRIAHTASAVNYLQVTGAATGNAPVISAQGTDTNLAFNVQSKGSGDLNLIGGSGGWVSINPGSVRQFAARYIASAVNYLTVWGSTSGSNATTLSAAYANDTNVDVNIASKAAGVINLQTSGLAAGGTTQVRVVDTASAVNYIQMSGAITSSAPYVLANGSDTDVPLVLSSKGAASILFKTAGTTPTQFVVAHTASAVNYVQATGGSTGVGVTVSAQGADSNVSMTVATKGTGSTTIFTPTSVGGTATDARDVVNMQGNAGGNNLLLRASLFRHTTGSDWTGVSYRLSHLVDVTAMSNIEFNPVGQSQGLAVNVAANAPFQVKTTGGEQFRVADTASAVNYIQASGSATGSGVVLSAQGTDSNVRFNISSKGSSGVGIATNNFSQLQLNVGHTASAVNYIEITGAATGGLPILSSQGTDTNIGLRLQSKGTGDLRLVTGGGEQVRIIHAASAVNFIQMQGRATGSGPLLSVNGSDTNIFLAMSSKGTGQVGIYTNNFSQEQFRVAHTASAVNYVQVTGAATGGTPTISATGSDANVFLVLTGKGAGGIVFDNPGYGNYFSATHAGATTVNANHIRVTATTTGSGPRLIATGTDTNIDLNFLSAGTGAHVFTTGGGQQVRINDATTAGPYTLFSRDNINNAQMITAANTANMYIQATGGGSIRFNTLVGSETQVTIDRTVSAVNFLRFTGSATGSAVSVSVLGSDSNVGMSFAGKGTGTLNLNSNTTFNANTLLFTGSNTAITLRVADNGILSFEGGAGQLFSIANNLTGQIFAVNDISGIPSLEVYSNGQVNIARYNGNVSIGTSTSTLTVNGAVSFGNAATFSNTITVTGTATFSNTIVANGALNITAGANAITFTNATSNYIAWNTAGAAAPTVTSRSAGTKLVLYPFVGATTTDFSIGIEANYMWFGAPNFNADGFKWYANTTNIMTSNSIGLNILSGGLSINGTSAIDLNRNGSFANVTIAGNLTVSGTTTYINTTTLNIGDNIITLNADLPGATAPTENAGIEVNRGSSANVSFIWDETNDVWASQINATSKLTVSNTIIGVAGNTYLFVGAYNGEGGEIVFANTTGGTGQIIDVDAGNQFRINSYSDTTHIRFNTGVASHTTKLQISANGNIGIGNTTPIHLLRVEGTGSFSSTLQATTFDLGSSMFFGTSSGNPAINFDSNDYLLYNKSTNLLTFAIGGTAQLTQNTTVLYAGANVGIGNTAPTEKLRVEGTLSHLGLVPSTGTGIDQIFTATPSITLNTTWQSTGVTSTNLANGTYVVQLLANDIAAGGTANNEYYSGMMSWYSADTNSTVLDEIPLHRAGVSGSNNAIFLATQRTATANTSDLLLMISSAANNSGASTYTIKLRRMI
jgi:hypothetical protein